MTEMLIDAHYMYRIYRCLVSLISEDEMYQLLHVFRIYDLVQSNRVIIERNLFAYFANKAKYFFKVYLYQIIQVGMILLQWNHPRVNQVFMVAGSNF